VQSFHLAVDQWPVVGVGRPPIVQTYAVSKPVRQPVCNRETPAPLQLCQHNYHLPETKGRKSFHVRLIKGKDFLPVKRRHRVDSAQLTPCRNNIVALLAVAFDIDPLVLVSVLHHHYQTSPAFGQVISSHSFATLLKSRKSISDDFKNRDGFLDKS
jgi:hypothetical protein